MYQKRGQVTLFVVVGIVILISAFLVYYFTSRQAVIQGPETLLKETPSQVRDVRLYIDECINIVGKQAVVNLGAHGGWIYDESDPELMQKPFDVEFNPTEGQGVEFSSGGLKVPYWYYMKSNNKCRNCQFSLDNVPSRSTMTAGINLYVQKKIDACLKDFKPLLQQGYTIRKSGDVQVDTKIAPDAVIVDIKYPLEIKRDDKTYTMEDFTTTLPVKLGRVYDLATLVVNNEQKSGFIEYATMSMVSAYATVDSSYFPPIAAATIGPSKMFWSKTGVMQKLQDALVQHTFLFTIPRTHNFAPAVYDESEKGFKVKQGATFSYVMNLIPENENYNDVDANFYYLGWPIYFDISPSDGELIGPNDIDSNMLNFLQVFSRQYNFAYDISYPVVVELRDVDAFNKQGFSFMFAMESNVRNNDALKPGELVELSKFGTSKRTLMNDPIEKISGNIKVVVRDDDLAKIKDAIVRYSCGQDSLYVGKTNEKGELVSRLPICLGGAIGASKQGYVSGIKGLDTSVGTDAFTEIIIDKIYKKNATIEVREKQELTGVTNAAYGSLSQEDLLQMIGASGRPLKPSESVYLRIEKVRSPEENIFNRAYIFNNETKVLEIELTKGKQEVRIELIDAEGVYIPEETIVLDEDGDILSETMNDINMALIGGEETKEVDIPAINITPAVRGGAILNNETGYWFVDDFSIKANNSVKFFAARQRAPGTVRDINLLGNNEEDSTDSRSLIEPEWVD